MPWKHICRIAILAAAFLAPAARAADDIVLADFEGKDYGDWKTTGGAFGPGPAQGTLPQQMPVTGFVGHGLVNSFYGGDQSTGTLTSPPFAINRSYISFLIGGGGFEGKTCMNLLVDAKVVRTATGPNTEPGGSEALSPQHWDVRDLAGKTGVIQIVDQATGGWGHINVDQIVLTDHKPTGTIRDATRQIVLASRFLNLPVRTGAPKRRMSVRIEGSIVREFEIELADATPDFWVFLDVAAWKGKTAELHVDQLPQDSAALKSVEQGDEVKGAAEPYHERLRPQFHFSPRVGWINDPNGLVFYKGEYHLFFQHNPYGWDWGNMHWGHAVSPDLVHWTQLPIAIYPRRFGDWAFSGSAVVDSDNTAGFKTGDEDAVVAAFTSTGRGECIAYSNDRGRSWSEFAGNPVVKHAGRDPRLLWHAPTRKWVMAVYDEADKTQSIAFYTSPDLKSWEFASRIEGFYECPDLFELPVDGDVKSTRWVLTAASSEYRIGQFDGRSFTPETPKLPGHRGNAMYAAQTYSDIPRADGRRIQIGWGQVATPGMPFNRLMCFPCELTLHTTPDGIRMYWQPVREIEKLQVASRTWQTQALKEGDNPLSDYHAELADLSADFVPGGAVEVGFRIHGTEIRYDVRARELICGNRKAQLSLEGGHVSLRVLVDRTSLEIFGNNGALYMPMAAVQLGDDQSLAVYARGKGATVEIKAGELSSIWGNGSTGKRP